MHEKINLKDLPTSPGCYLFKDQKGQVIYVGKAKNIKKRVSSYFQKKEHDAKTTLLVSYIDHCDFILTKNEIEAFLLENRLIKKYYPKYNIDLKDSRRYAYLRLTDEEVPWLETIRKREGKGTYFGPFVWGNHRKSIIQILSRQFGVLLNKPSPRKKKSIDNEAYQRRLKQAKKLLKGEVDTLIKSLKGEMKKASEKIHYEHALNLRNQIHALEFLKEKQHVELSRQIDAHIINYIITDKRVFLMLFSVVKGMLEDKQEFEFDYTDNFLEEFLMRFYEYNDIPQEIIIPEKVSTNLAVFLGEQKGKKVRTIHPQKGEKKALLELVKKNVEASYFKGQQKLLDLKKFLNLNEIPRTIECFDISHLGGTSTVASMVSFKDGVASKSDYRRFKIKTVSDGDDFRAMHEVVKRRYQHLKKAYLPFPDLIVIDGGAIQLEFAQKALDELYLKLNMVALAKKFEEVYTQKKKKPLKLSKKRPGLQLLQEVRDEAHRFAVAYNRTLRRKKLLE